MTRTFAYDENGNRTDGDFQTDEDNRLGWDGTFEYLYDAEGNCVSKTRITPDADPDVDWRTEYTWDHRNRLTRVVIKNASESVIEDVEYTYDYLDRRICKGAEGGMCEYHIHRGDTVVATIWDSDGLTGGVFGPALGSVNLYDAAVDEILAVDDGSAVEWSLADHEGSVRDILDDTGALIEHRDYTAYGEISRFDNTGTEIPDTVALDFVFAFTGREWDDDIHLANHRARWYDPHAARFINQDPSGFAGGDSSRGKKAAKPLRTPPRAAGATLEIGLCGLNRLEYGHPPVSV